MQGSKRDTDVKNRLLDSVRKGEGGMIWENSIEALYYIIYYHIWNRWPVQVWCMKQGTQSRCSGTTQRDGVGREVGEGFRLRGSLVHPWLIHVDVWQKPPQYFKVTGLQLKYINYFEKIVNKALVSCIQPGLVISFTIDNIHVLMLFSQNIPPSAISLLSHHAEIYISAQPYSLLISVATNLFTNWIFLAGEPYLNCSSFTPQFTYLLTFQINWKAWSFLIRMAT